MVRPSTRAKQEQLKSQLLNQFRASLNWAAQETELSRRRVSSLYELFVMETVLEVAETERDAQIEFIRNGERVSPPNNVQTGPHRIRDGSYTYARIKFRHLNKQVLEVHTGLKFRGKSGILTECDVAVLGEREANRSRNCSTPRAGDCRGRLCCDPRDHRIIFSVECKCYTRNISLEMAREFVGLSEDLSVPYGDVFYVVSYPIARNGRDFLNHHRDGKYVPSMTPTVARTVDALKEKIREAFNRYNYI